MYVSPDILSLEIESIATFERQRGWNSATGECFQRISVLSFLRSSFQYVGIETIRNALYRFNRTKVAVADKQLK